MKLFEIVDFLQKAGELDKVSIVGNREVVIDGLNLGIR